MNSAMLFRAGLLACLCLCSPTAAEDSAGAGPILKLLQSGRVPEARLPAIVEIVCQRGNAADLTYIFEQTVKADGYQGDARRAALQGLIEAAFTRKVEPTGDLGRLGALLQLEPAKQSGETLALAVRLAGLWKVESLAPQLQQVALSPAVTPELRQAALSSLAALGRQAAMDTINQLTDPKQPLASRVAGVCALAELDLPAATSKAAGILRSATVEDDLSELWQTLLSHQQGPAQLAAAIKDNRPAKEVALVNLRYLYSIGRTDQQLVDELSDAAGLEANPKPLTPEEVKALAREVEEAGDAERGELVFRRAEVSCQKCHAVSQAGGSVGPDLSAVGVSSPVDYLVNSILFPNQAVKEAYLTKIILTVEGRTHQGIVVDRDDQKVTLKDATGKLTTIATGDIDDEVEGSSLMPQGLTKFLTKQELLDLVKFLSQLGRPAGAYPVRTRPTVQRWRLLRQTPPELVESVPDVGSFQQILEAPATAWVSVYGKVAGELPLAELAQQTRQKVFYLQGEVNVTEAGEIGVSIPDTEGVTVWVGDEEYRSQSKFRTELAAGRHPLTLRVDTTQRKSATLRAEFERLPGSTAEFTVVDGQ